MWRIWRADIHTDLNGLTTWNLWWAKLTWSPEIRAVSDPANIFPPESGIKVFGMVREGLFEHLGLVWDQTSTGWNECIFFPAGFKGNLSLVEINFIINGVIFQGTVPRQPSLPLRQPKEKGGAWDTSQWMLELASWLLPSSDSPLAASWLGDGLVTPNGYGSKWNRQDLDRTRNKKQKQPTHFGDTIYFGQHSKIGPAPFESEIKRSKQLLVAERESLCTFMTFFGNGSLGSKLIETAWIFHWNKKLNTFCRGGVTAIKVHVGNLAVLGCKTPRIAVFLKLSIDPSGRSE